MLTITSAHDFLLGTLFGVFVVVLVFSGTILSHVMGKRR